MKRGGEFTSRRILADRLAKLRAAHAAKKAAQVAEAPAREDANQQLVAPAPNLRLPPAYGFARRFALVGPSCRAPIGATMSASLPAWM